MTDTPNWMTRRQEALETGLDALKRMTTCRTPVEMAVIYGEWLSGSMSRVMADIEDVQKASKMLVSSPLTEPASPAERQELRQAA